MKHQNVDGNDYKIQNGITIDINSADVKVSEVMTYDELVDKIAKDQGISIEEVQKTIKPKELKITRDNIQPRAGTYRTFSYSLPVNSSYKPSVEFYCETSEWGNWHGIERVLNVSMNRGYNGLSKIFNGSIYVNLERADTIYFIANGDFYNQGSVTVGVGVDIPVGGTNTVKFNASYTSSYYGYIYKADRIYW